MHVNLRLVQAYVALVASAVTLLGGGPRLTAQEPVTCDAKCATAVFSDSGEALSAADKQEIASQLPFKVAPDGKSLVDSVCEQGAQLELTTPDLNADGNVEVFVLGGNSCLSGFTGSSVWLFIKDASGKYKGDLGFPAGAYESLKTKNLGYPDLMFGGPGFCHAVWRWNGKAYDFLRNQAEQPGGCEGVGQ